jgi:hypothetical protein
MTKTKATILTVVLIGAVVTPIAMKLSHHAGFGRKQLALRLALLPPLTTVQIEAYLTAQNRDAESLLAAYRASTNATYLAEAVARFPENPHVLYSLIANNAAVPGEERNWIDAYKAATPDNALAWYFSANEYFKSGEIPLAVKELERATQASEFLDERVWTIQAVEKLHRSAGRAPDEAWPAAFLACSLAPHRLPMKNLARNISQTAAEYRQRRNAAGAESLARMGLTLGQRLSAPGASQSLINTMVGTAIEKMFLSQLDPATAVADGQTIAAATAVFEKRQFAVKELTHRIASLFFLSDAELSAYFDRVKSQGEEAAFGGLKSSPLPRK